MIFPLLWLAAAALATSPIQSPEEMAGVLQDVQQLGVSLANRNLSAIQKVLMAVAASNGTNSTADEVLHGVDEIVNETLEPAVERDFSVAQDEISGFHELFLKCEEDQLSAFNNSVLDQKKVVHFAEEHLICRKHQVLLLDANVSCTTLLQAARTVEDAKCALYERSRTVPEASVVCQAQQHEDAEAYHQRKIKELEDSLAQLLTRKKDCEEAKVQAQLQSERCEKAREDLANGQKACDAKQLMVDSTVCALQTRMGVDCSAYDSCRKQAMASFMQANESVKMTEAELQATWMMLKQVRCMINGAKERSPLKVALCSQERNFSVAHLIINYSSVPPFAPCQSLAEPPGSPQYMTALYGHMPPRAPASPCEASCCNLQVIR